ncbi:MAG: sigma-54-dependent Fis family transcriptional regulator [Chloracidobacterium sp.]|nr:sigma-54-dependent Fis family transcriptional regulator [Chloracidobacterium sp.]MBL0239519.1 sigma-54-dependent Fis family transcriptional regulator [Chloracidobacterium sp.]
MNNQFANANTDTASSIFEDKIALYARVPHYILITGERGTGKTTIARQIHDHSLRSEREFVGVNCASFSSELLESELFGYEKGAFTGAIAPKAGLFEAAGGGTLFLDEIGELSLSLQAKFLKAVEERRIRRVGGTRDREIDVRIIAATSRDLLSMVNSGSFRADLFDRLNILQLETLPLRFQKERILETFFDQLEKERATIGIELPFKFEKDALAAIQELEWKGNYRELRNFATRLAVESIDEVEITHQCVNRLVRDRDRCQHVEMPILDENESFLTVILDPETDDLDSVYVKAAATFIEHALKQSNGNLRRAARSINTTHSTISRILKKNQERFVDTSDKVIASYVAAA